MKTLLAYFVLVFALLTSFSAHSQENSSCGLLTSEALDAGDLTSSVDLILVSKADRKMIVFNGGRALKQYHVSLGFTPVGAKTRSGDGKTPEGKYFVDYKNPESAYHLSLLVSYPNTQDLERARRLKVDPGGNIMIHGFPNESSAKATAATTHNTTADWTQGCVGVTDSEIEEIFSHTEEGTAIEICP